MKKCSNIKVISFSILSFLLGMLTVLLLQYIEPFVFYYEDSDLQDTGDIVIRKEIDLSKEGIYIEKGDNPILFLSQNRLSKNLEHLTLFDNFGLPFGEFYMNDSGLKSVDFLNYDQSAFFQMKHNDSGKKQWKATYGMVTENKILGNFYYDLNLDGQFDVMQVFDEMGDYIGCMVYFNWEWKVADSIDKSLSNAEIIWDITTKDKLKLSFDFDQGWVPAARETRDRETRETRDRHP